MKQPSIIKAGVASAVTAAVTVTLSGLVPGTAAAGPAFPEMAKKLTGKTVFLDPGHQGPGHGENVAKQVSDGRGGMKDCQTTGMTTVHGVAEHTINWNVAQLVQTSLESLGARVVLSRQDDQGWGGCIDERAAAANKSGADVAVSIHADSAPADQRGFHLIVPELPIPDAMIDKVQSGAGLAASKAMRDAYLQSGFVPAPYASADGLMSRRDIAGPALTKIPDVFIEMGNGANLDDAAQLESREGQLKHAMTITTGLVSYLLGPPGTTPAAAGGADNAPAPQPDPSPVPAAAPDPSPVPAVAPVPANSPLQPHPASIDPPGGQAAPQTLTPLPGQAAPQAQNVPQAQSVPNAPSAPNAQSAPNPQTAPQGQASPFTPPAPGTQQSTPGTQQSPSLPGTSPSTDTPSDMAAVREIMDMVLELVMPLAKALGVDNNMVTAELINLAYALAAKFLAPAK
ncbi:N-acetylmuramoyl-L-alanine amidase [Nocardia brasiliensis]|uniref:N-acetylmuramoyl-L-alanine amidase n=1 Tax=Nocardia brasiliensis TaxID=37326 RepID=UPI00189509AC|nr:N-acetylmuramoyl-L-alanine amidase [Nocardia brasiliensis]